MVDKKNETKKQRFERLLKIGSSIKKSNYKSDKYFKTLKYHNDNYGIDGKYLLNI